MEVKQCELVSINGLVVHVAWIPVRFAVHGKVLDLKHRGEWTGPWRVREVYQNVETGERVREHQRVDLPSLK